MCISILGLNICGIEAAIMTEHIINHNVCTSNYGLDFMFKTAVDVVYLPTQWQQDT